MLNFGTQSVGAEVPRPELLQLDKTYLSTSDRWFAGASESQEARRHTDWKAKKSSTFMATLARTVRQLN
jgi:hypothetical protein